VFLNRRTVIGLPALLLMSALAGCLYSLTVPPGSFRSRPPGAVPPLELPSRGRLPAAWQPVENARGWKFVVLHHTATESGSVSSIDRVHRQRIANGRHWLGIGYHFVIGNGQGMPDGQVESTFRWTRQIEGAHAGVADYNQYGIGIALIGNFETRPPTAAQLAAARQLVSALRTEYAISADRVIGHGDVKATACPGRFFSVSAIR